MNTPPPFDPKAAQFSTEQFPFSPENPVFCGGDVVTESGSYYHVHPGIEFGTCLSGEGYYYLGGAYYRMEKGDSYFFDSLVPHANVLDEGMRFEEISVHCPLESLFAATQFKGDTRLFEPFVAIRSGFSPIIPKNKRIESLVREIKRVCDDRKRFWDMKVWSLMVVVYTEIAAVCLPEIHSKEPPRSGRQRGIVARAVGYINDNVTSDFRTEQLASHCAISPSRLTHLFTEAMGVSPGQYRSDLRVGLAVNRLCTTDDKITSVALDCGFNSFSQFMEVFKRVTGKTPGSVRRKARSLPPAS